MAAAGWSSTFKLANEPGSLGLSCSEKGVTLAGVPLLRRGESGFTCRPPQEIRRLIGCAYDVDADATSLVRGLDGVSRALNAGDMARAMVAAVQLRLPELDWHGAVRIARAEDDLAKYDPNEPRDWHGRWTTVGGGARAIPPTVLPSCKPRPVQVASLSTSNLGVSSQGAGNPERGGATTAPVGSRNAPANASEDDWVQLPPGKRIDELGDLLEWIANAKPQDEQAIRAEIKRLYYDVGDVAGGNALTLAASRALYGNPDRDDREAILEDFERYTRVDPADVARLTQALTAFGLLSELGIASGFLPAETETAAAEASNAWKLGWAVRGRVIEKALGANLPSNFPVIDRFADGVVTSIKSIDLNAGVYQDAARLSRRIDTYVDQLAKFQGKRWANRRIALGDIIGRTLNVAIPKSGATAAQWGAIKAATARASSLGVKLVVTPF